MEIIDLAEQVVSTYSIRSYHAAYRQGVSCGCRSCQGEMQRWVDWTADENNTMESLLSAQSQSYGRSTIPTTNGFAGLME